jgi:hypothetical protein
MLNPKLNLKCDFHDFNSDFELISVQSSIFFISNDSFRTRLSNTFTMVLPSLRRTRLNAEWKGRPEPAM